MEYSKEFKVLTYGPTMVDHKLLDSGIYATVVPTLMPKDTTIETIIDILGKGMVGTNYVKNLKKCNLKTVNVSIAPNERV